MWGNAEVINTQETLYSGVYWLVISVHVEEQSGKDSPLWEAIFLLAIFQDFKMRFATKEFASAYQLFQPVGIAMGCAIYRILFFIAKEKVTTFLAAFSSWRGIKIELRLKLQEIPAFMDDLTLLNRWRLLSTWTSWYAGVG